MKSELKNEIIDDFHRAKDALVSAKKNFEDNDVPAASNRVFVACENAIYVRLKIMFGNTTFSRRRILLKIGSISPSLKDLYERSYDMRVQADYGRRSRIAELNRKNVEDVIKETENLISNAETEMKNAGVL